MDRSSGSCATIWLAREISSNPRDLPKPPFKRNQFGFTLGGPVVKNHAFFFVGFEETGLRHVNPRVGCVPTPEMVRGDFSALPPGTVIKDPLTG